MSYTCGRCGKVTDRSGCVFLHNISMPICMECLASAFPGTSWIKCHDCGRKCTIDLMKSTIKFNISQEEVHNVCAKCINDHYVTCHGCGRCVDSSQVLTRNGSAYCRTCRYRTMNGAPATTCRHCGTSFMPSTVMQEKARLCHDCIGFRPGRNMANFSIVFKKSEENDRIVSDPGSEI